MILYVAFFAQIILIYFISQWTIQHLFRALYRITKSTFVSSYILALLYFPGTLLHELSHFITAVALLLNVKEMDLIPVVKKSDDDKRYVKLGSVVFEQKDYFRSMLVGIAPFFVGLGFFFFMFEYDIFPNENIWINVLSLYLLFSVSSSMFSSKKDLEGTIIIVPLIILIFSILVGFNIDITRIFLSETTLEIMRRLNMYLLIATGGNSLIYVILRLFRI
ncbi:hypothetical protein A3H80_01475 [Candidatus Roizmanbacteria bacterium RIFCSPLOWO2_02_FULL_37_19]|uniref:Uncharacterized protein n=1 Tax=Candidatus Roizmanbacteria bacterium RIFCSPHIGHO2_02_FULL_37_24 TaxID=1802037 RepID=A0A1F7GWX8_9BACT|nr:MAG: hypothetical protein A2862_01495 [Candidatus Roizmanbacteria bacterium RIFCSPHIGHO2_01_FULL_38_41]OGK22992.1 MAG: hypothetical protein A3C24_02530 [Candidatus Roizmanbacteria bacterium RIFCSPHIGHO2_02_FULL_37_24]OGK32227.1 MAG: hypothetical protein A3E10_02195 [Candidatus Roizmanbacteria bacterium RIFCSPHIGHO2_12_FULL_37_23]OGK45655.1 MAG: hypothetical protein A2956_00695 [Candidatus Roizmanbacteria bacterium RIFCSPLOWO2_01_FULL_37_57]OGK53860.1 MAG: hypothetical protein A3H80_01475 [Ca